MKIKLIYRNGVFVPCYDEDYQAAHTLKQNTVFQCNIKEIRNLDFNRKYHTLIDRAWNCLNEKQIAFFGERGKEAFRKSMEITAGFYEPVFDFTNNKGWNKAPRSTAFDKMSESEFQELYNGVYDAIRSLLTNGSMTEQQFDAVFDGF